MTMKIWRRALDKGSARASFAVGALLSFPGPPTSSRSTSFTRQDLRAGAVIATVIGFCLIMLAIVEVPLLGYAFAPRGHGPDNRALQGLDHDRCAADRHKGGSRHRRSAAAAGEQSSCSVEARAPLRVAGRLNGVVAGDSRARCSGGGVGIRTDRRYAPDPGDPLRRHRPAGRTEGSRRGRPLELRLGPCELLAEATLALVLFSDASRINLRELRRGANVPVRLLGIGLPLTILLGALAAAATFGQLSIEEAVIIGVVLAPTDAALGQAVVTNKRVPARIRQGLNVESGLNDGICVPLLFIAVAAADVHSELAGGRSAATPRVRGDRLRDRRRGRRRAVDRRDHPLRRAAKADHRSMAAGDPGRGRGAGLRDRLRP